MTSTEPARRQGSAPLRRSGQAPPGGPPPPQRSEGWPLGSLAGIPIILARSWFIIAAIITFEFEPVVSSTDPTLSRTATFAVALGYAVLLGASVLVHELAHALVAKAFGLPVTRIVLTLWGGHTQFEEEVPSPARSFAVAVAGPVANGVIGLIAYVAVTHSSTPPLIALLLYALAVTNGFVALTNVLPGLPLDGGRLLEAVVWRVGGDRDLGTLAAGWVGRVVAVGVPVVALGWPLLHGAPVSWFTVVWAGMIGALLWAGAGAALAGARIRRRAPAASITALARPAVSAPSGALLPEALSAADTRPGGAWVVLVDPTGTPVGVLDPDAVDAVPEHRRPGVLASSAARALPPGAVVPDSLSGQDLLRALSAVPSEEWVVLDSGGSVTGLLLAREVIAAVMGARAASRA